MNVLPEQIPILLLTSNQEIHRHLRDLLDKNKYEAVSVSGLDELIDKLKPMKDVIVLLDAETISIYGLGIYSRIRSVSPGCRMILLCRQAHRDFIKEAMALGVYGCIVEPFAEWEVLTMLKHILSDIQPKKRRPARKRKKTS